MDKLPVTNTKIAARVCEFERIKPSYEKLVKEVKFVVEEKFKDSKIKVAKVSGRAKTTESFKEKLARKGYINPLKEITDLAGVRVVCYYESDLSEVGDIVRSNFEVHEHVNKSDKLGVDKMGYNGEHFIVTFGSRYTGPHYDGLTNLKCEIQIRTVLQDSWALISHHLIYKDEASIPKRMKRDLNNVASVLEVAQGVFDSIRKKLEMYRTEIREKEQAPPEFLKQSLDYETLVAYTEWKYPDLPLSEHWHARLLADLRLEKYQTLCDLDVVVEQAKEAVEAYRKENPGWFMYGTDFLTKSLGFVDDEFRSVHPFGEPTIKAFKKFGYLVKKAKKVEK